MEPKLKHSLIQDWQGYKGRPFLISGPCSAETEEQVMETATQLAKIEPGKCVPCRNMETPDTSKFI